MKLEETTDNQRTANSTNARNYQFSASYDSSVGGSNAIHLLIICVLKKQSSICQLLHTNLFSPTKIITK